jgi:hypothetical protein
VGQVWGHQVSPRRSICNFNDLLADVCRWSMTNQTACRHLPRFHKHNLKRQSSLGPMLTNTDNSCMFPGRHRALKGVGHLTPHGVIDTTSALFIKSLFCTSLKCLLLYTGCIDLDTACNLSNRICPGVGGPQRKFRSTLLAGASHALPLVAVVGICQGSNRNYI